MQGGELGVHARVTSPIRSMFGEVRYELVKIILLNVFLSTVIFFLIADLVGLVFGMPLWYVLIAAAVYFTVDLTGELRKISVRVVEEKNPELREMLRTAKDNQDQDSLMAHALFSEVLDRMRRVSSGTFLDFRKLMLKLGAVFMLSIILVSLAFFDISIQRFEDPLKAPFMALGRLLGGGGVATGQDQSGVGGPGDELFGDARMADLGDQQLVATVKPGLDNPDFNQLDPTSPSSDPLKDLGGADAGFNDGGPGYESGLDERDLQRSYEYAKQTQG